MRPTLCLLNLGFLVCCARSSSNAAAVTPPSSGQAHPACLEASAWVQPTPNEAPHRRYRNKGFDRFTSVEAASGNAVHLYAQDQVSDLKLLRARNLLEFFLSDVPGTTWGADKADVLQAMADNEAALILPNGEHTPSNEYDLPAQPLYDAETPLAGSTWFMENDWDHRDAAFEEIFHLVHDSGIGTYLPGVRPEYQADLDAEARAAIDDGRWGIPVDPGVAEWLQELEREDSLAQEYIASVIDTYYGLWGPWDEDDGGMWGIYIAKTRDELPSLDPAGQALVEQFLPQLLTHEVRLDPALDEDFHLEFDPNRPYTHKSQYMTWVSASGSNNINLYGNAADNTLRGNSGDNELHGGDGTDTVVLCGPMAQFIVDQDAQASSSSMVIVTGPEGTDALFDVERLVFTDGVIEL